MLPITIYRTTIAERVRLRSLLRTPDGVVRVTEIRSSVDGDGDLVEIVGSLGEDDGPQREVSYSFDPGDDVVVIPSEADAFVIWDAVLTAVAKGRTAWLDEETERAAADGRPDPEVVEAPPFDVSVGARTISIRSLNLTFTVGPASALDAPE